MIEARRDEECGASTIYRRDVPEPLTPAISPKDEPFVLPNSLEKPSLPIVMDPSHERQQRTRHFSTRTETRSPVTGKARPLPNTKNASKKRKCSDTSRPSKKQRRRIKEFFQCDRCGRSDFQNGHALGGHKKYCSKPEYANSLAAQRRARRELAAGKPSLRRPRGGKPVVAPAPERVLAPMGQVQQRRRAGSSSSSSQRRGPSMSRSLTMAFVPKGPRYEPGVPLINIHKSIRDWANSSDPRMEHRMVSHLDRGIRSESVTELESVKEALQESRDTISQLVRELENQGVSDSDRAAMPPKYVDEDVFLLDLFADENDDQLMSRIDEVYSVPIVSQQAGAP